MRRQRPGPALPRPVSQPWLDEAVGTARWTGTPLAALLADAGVRDDAVDVVFTGADHGIERGVEQDYQRALADRRRARSGRPRRPRHERPAAPAAARRAGAADRARLVRHGPRQVARADHRRSTDAVRPVTRTPSPTASPQDADDAGEPVDAHPAAALLIPPGFPDFQTRTRIVERGVHDCAGRAWSGTGPITAGRGQRRRRRDLARRRRRPPPERLRLVRLALDVARRRSRPPRAVRPGDRRRRPRAAGRAALEPPGDGQQPRPARAGVRALSDGAPRPSVTGGRVRSPRAGRLLGHEARHRAGAGDPRRGDLQPRPARAVPRSHRPPRPDDQRRRHARRGPGRAPRPTPPTPRTRAGGPLPPLHGLPDHRQGRHRDGRHPLHRRRRRADRPRAGGRRAGRRPAARGAGAIVFGKTNLPRWSGDVQSFNEIFGTTNNPWDVDAHPRRLVGRPGGRGRRRLHVVRARHRHRRLGPHPVALLRHVRAQAELRRRSPSAATSTASAAARPTPTSTCSARWPAAPSDLDLLLVVLAGPGAGTPGGVDARAAAGRVQHARRSAHRRVARRPGDARPTRRCSPCCGRAVDRLADAGAEVDRGAPAGRPAATRSTCSCTSSSAAIAVSNAGVAASGSAGSHYAWLQARPRSGPRCRRRGRRGSRTTTRCSHRCCSRPRSRTCRTATSSTRELLVVDGETRPYLSVVWWTGMFGVLGLPVAVPPVGRTADGLPVGVQVVTPYLRDRDAVRAAGLIAEVAGGTTSRPASDAPRHIVARRPSRAVSPVRSLEDSLALVSRPQRARSTRAWSCRWTAHPREPSSSAAGRRAPRR